MPSWASRVGDGVVVAGDPGVVPDADEFASGPEQRLADELAKGRIGECGELRLANGFRRLFDGDDGVQDRIAVPRGRGWRE